MRPILKFLAITGAVATFLLAIAIVSGARGGSTSDVGLVVLGLFVGVACAGAHVAHTTVLVAADGRPSRPWLALPAAVGAFLLVALLVGERDGDAATLVLVASVLFGASFASICAMVGVHEYRKRQGILRRRAARRSGSRVVGEMHVSVHPGRTPAQQVVCASRLGAHVTPGGEVLVQVSVDVPRTTAQDAFMVAEQDALSTLLGAPAREVWSEPFTVCIAVDAPGAAAGAEHWAVSRRDAIDVVLTQVEQVHAARGLPRR